MYKYAILIMSLGSLGAVHRTPNFVINAPSAQAAKKVGEVAEHYRESLAVEWLGKEMPPWDKPCHVTVQIGQVGAGGETKFAFDRGQVFGWKMRVQGSLERILDSVIPHEITHTILACHFRRPLPRWADEGAATLIEHESERRRQQLMLEQVIKSGRRIPLRKLLSLKEYPSDMRDVLTLYAEGYSLADFLVENGGKSHYLKFLEDAHKQGWDRAIKANYRVQGVEALEKSWSRWIADGSPRIDSARQTQLASTSARRGRPDSPQRIVRSQSPEAKKTGTTGRRTRRRRQRRGSLQPKEPARISKPRNLAVASADTRRRNKSAKPSKAVRHDRSVAQAAEGRAMNAGWIPMSETAPRVSRPRPLELWRSKSALARANSPAAGERKASKESGASRRSSGNAKRKRSARSLPRTDLRLNDLQVGDRVEIPDGEQTLDSDRQPSWSNFPQDRAGHGPIQLGQSTTIPFSP